MKHDLVIAHRVCPALSKTAIGFTDKRTMVVATTASLAKALEGLSVRLIVILDGCRDYVTIFTDSFGSSSHVELEIIHTDAIGNQATWGKQLEFLSEVKDSEFVYFSEDDYIYRPDAFRAMLDFIKNRDVDFVSPLDHPERYNGKLERPYPTFIRTSSFCHWRETMSSCLTFMAKAKVVAESRRVMESYLHSSEEATMWLGLTKHGVFDFLAMVKAAFRHFILRRQCSFGELMGLCTWKRQGFKLFSMPQRKLFSPIPSLAVHLASCSLPPGSLALLKGHVPENALGSIQEAESKTLMLI